MLLPEGLQLLVQVYESTVLFASLLIHFRKSSFHAIILLFHPVEVDFEVVVLVGDLFYLKGGLDSVTPLRSRIQNLV